MMATKAQPAQNEENDPYRKIFWIVVAAAVSLAASGVYAFMSKAAIDAGNYATLTANLQNLTSKVDALSQDVKAGTLNRYTGADAANDRAAIMALINHNADAIEKLQQQVADLRKFRASMSDSRPKQ